MRPENLDGFIGQKHILSPENPFRKILETGNIPSMVLWGPPGVGKTTLAFIISKMHKFIFIPFSAVFGSIKEIKEIMHKTSRIKTRSSQKFLFFIDEVHRLNKAQQDAFLPYVEKGDIVFIGATTENPSFEIIPALLSRVKVITLKPLSLDDIKQIIRRALEDKIKGYGNERIILTEQAMDFLAHFSDGDCRKALNALELAVEFLKSSHKTNKEITIEFLKDLEQKKIPIFDKAGEEFYNVISALHKSIRNSDVDASIYWLVRMIEGGADLLYIARRLIRVASEDIGNADPKALPLTIAAKDAVHFLGAPEGFLALVQAVIYLAAAPKSNSVYIAYENALNAVKNTLNEPVPLAIRNPVTPLMKGLGYGKDYLYAHNFKEKTTPLQCMPPSLADNHFYFPIPQGFEKIIARRLKRLSAFKKKSDN
jgi:putative ATPase